MSAVLLAVISDIHGNRIALDAALQDIERSGCDGIVCLGDVAEGGAQPRESTERLRELEVPVVMGNSDAFILGIPTLEPVTEQQALTREWTIEQLGAEGLESHRWFQPTLEIPLDADARLLCFHGSPASYDDILLPESASERFETLTSDASVKVMAGGHTHTQWLRAAGDRIFFNPGSVGLSYNRRLPEEIFRCDPWADYALLRYEDGVPTIEFRQVPFDVEALIEVIERSGMPLASSVAERHRPIAP